MCCIMYITSILVLSVVFVIVEPCRYAHFDVLHTMYILGFTIEYYVVGLEFWVIVILPLVLGGFLSNFCLKLELGLGVVNT